MDSLKLILSIAIMMLSIGLIGLAIWVILFGFPKAAMDGGTLVQSCPWIVGGGFWLNQVI